MTIQEAIAIATALRPTELDEALLTKLVLDLEHRISAEIRGERLLPRAVMRTELTVPPPFDRVYWTYLIAMIDLAACNAEAYAASDALYRESLDAYARWHHRTGGGCQHTV